jgi:hypothetical protein
MSREIVDIKGNLKDYLKGIKLNLYCDEHCALTELLHLECDHCRLRFSLTDCMSSMVFHVIK